MLYPRDMRGYGEPTPAACWPNGARIAVQVVVNYEEGGENCVLHGDAASEAFLSEIVGASAWPGQRHWNMESIYEYGARAGFWRLHRLLTQKGVPVTVYGVATALMRSPHQVAAMQAADWEIASHGLKWIEYKDHKREDEKRDMLEAIRLHKLATGEAPRGWYTGRCSVNTVDLLTEIGGMAYLADSYADDLPYWYEHAGKAQLIVPYTLDCNDMRFATPQGFNSGEQFFTYLKDSFDYLYREGTEGAPKMLSVGLHCRLAGRPGRAAALARWLDYVQGHEGVWLARRIDIAEHWAANHPHQPSARPSRMSKAEFVAAFGGVFEHSPSIAAGTHEGELSAAHDDAFGLWRAMCAVFDGISEAEKLSIIRVHPDLAGKLAKARQLTDSSTEEQASAGLDALTDEERETFTALNEAYQERFGFPFIIAVKENTKASILAAFEARLQNSAEDELNEACTQIKRITFHRLSAILPAKG